MSIRIASAAAIAACNAINALVDGGSAGGKLNIYAGSRPATVDTAVSGQTLLVSFTLGDPSFGAATDVTDGGQATANSIAAVQAAATGTATWFRVFDSDNAPIFDGDVTNTAGSGDLKLSSVSIVSGIDVSVVSLTTKMPKG